MLLSSPSTSSSFSPSPSNIVDQKAIISQDNKVMLYPADYSGNRYYYTEGKVYDFYGYHLGGADVTDVVETNNSCLISIVLHGNNDLLYATTDRNKDLDSYNGKNLTAGQLYSATSARMGVCPVLRYSHALTRFKFVVKGVGCNYSMYDISGLEVESGNSGTLVIGEEYVGFIPSDRVGILKLKMGDDEFQVSEVTKNEDSIPLGGENASIMVAPGFKSMKVNLRLIKRQENIDVDHSFVVKSADIPLVDSGGKTYCSESFLPGCSYRILINVHGLEKIEIDSDGNVKPVVPPETPEDAVVGNGSVSVGDYIHTENLGSVTLE